ncbi:MAG: hypothetical protein JHC62_03155 [Microbacteriaceae bacterium]|nr:hypothetical protein [Microbacteriaceae bacterium]
MQRSRTVTAILASALTTTLAVATLVVGSTPAVAGKAPNNEPRPAAMGPQYTYSGERNNLRNPAWGSVSFGFVRTAPQGYSDGISALAGTDRPGARAVSNAISAQTESIINNRNLTDMVYVFGQFLDHDITRTIKQTGDRQPIAVPTGDPQFDPASTGTATIPFTRSTFVTSTGTSTTNPRQQNNWVTAFIDGSQVYGSDADRATALRTMTGGLMKTSEGNMLPFNSLLLENDNDAHQVADENLFLAGDVRANENPGITSLQTLFVREHNRIAGQIAARKPGLSDEAIYQKARQTVIAEMQWIVYNEYLPALLGSNAMPVYRGYSPRVNPSISNEFSTAAYRFGHSMLDDEVGRLNNDGTETDGGPLELAAAFFNPTVFDPSLPNHEGDIDVFLKAEITGEAQEVDVYINDGVRNFLFGPPGAGGLDLAALNIQRGRDHGLADYNTMRAAYGLPKVTEFSQITSDAALAAQLAATYGDVNSVDAWVGGLAEDHVAGGSLGQLFTKVIVNQFSRLRTGDRLYFEAWMSRPDVAAIKRTSLASIITANTALTTVQRNVFVTNG